MDNNLWGVYSNGSLKIFLITSTFFMFIHPKNITIWKDGQDVLAIPEILRNIVHLKNIRDFDYGDESTRVVQKYFDNDYDIDTIVNCTLYSVPFGKSWIYSHLILGFHFDDGQELVLSVEARRRPDEDFSVIKGFLPYYGLIYIWWTPKDLLGLRLHVRKDTIYAYKITFDKKICQKIFLDCLKRTDTLISHPETYGSLLNNCTTNIIKHCTDSLELPYPSFDYRVILSGKIEGYLREMRWTNAVVRLGDY